MRRFSRHAGFTTVQSERGASADQPEIYHSGRETSGQSPSNIGDPKVRFSQRSSGTLVALFSQGGRAVKSKVTKFFFVERSEAQKLFNIQADRAIQGDQALSELSEAESHAKILLEEQRNHALSETKFELLLEESRDERA